MKMVVKRNVVRDRSKDFVAAPNSSESAALAQVVHAASEAVTALADRLNALALRTALLGGVADSFGAEANVEGYLKRLSALVDSAGDQMRRIQKVLQILEATTTLRMEPQAAHRAKN